jgi:hypothetical protein
MCAYVCICVCAWDALASNGTHPVSWASWARMIDSSLFFSKKLHAALYLCIIITTAAT